MPENYRPPQIGHVVSPEELELIADAVGSHVIREACWDCRRVEELIAEIVKRPKFHRVGF